MKDLIINFVQRKKLYGDSHRVIAAYRKRIKQWSQIKHGDAKGYRGFWIFCLNLRPLLSCKHGMFWTLLTWCTCCCRSLGTMGQWENGQMVKAGVINQKIKERYRVGWSHWFCRWWKSYSGMIQSFQKKLLSSILKRKTTKTWEEIFNICSRLYKCINYGSNHQLDNYPSFMEKHLKKRISFLAGEKFCYACLQPMKQG